jgi:peptide chain release factor 3
VNTASPARKESIEANRRRTFAIISHPDAGKTTLTEKFLLYAGAVAEAGAVKARAGRRKATSDWMALEQQRGISVTSTVLQFKYREHIFNLLDTPGHRDFSEDTYRVLSAVDAAIMVLDAAKGIETQTLKLFEVCRAQSLPIITFINKFDRPGRDPLELLDQIERQINLKPTPVTWPVGIPGNFKGVIDRRDGTFINFTRSIRGLNMASEEILDEDTASQRIGDDWESAKYECHLLDEIGANLDIKSFLAGETTPLFVGSALTNFGVRHLLDAIVDLAPPPGARSDTEGSPRSLEEPFSGFVFKIQANMDPSHRDHLAFVRVCSGEFNRGMPLIHGRTGKSFSTKYATSVFGSDRDTIDKAYPGDVVGLVNASELQIGDTLYQSSPVTFPPFASFVPEIFSTVQTRDTSKHKQFRSGLHQLEREGVIQVLRDKKDELPIVLAAVGQMQFEVFAHRIQYEFGAEVLLSPSIYKVARVTDEATAEKLDSINGARVFARGDGTLMALFESSYWLDHVASQNPTWKLDQVS